jgi:hypothetical protein
MLVEMDLDAPIAMRRSRRATRLPARFADNGDPGSEDEGEELPERLVPLDADSGPALACSSASTGQLEPTVLISVGKLNPVL